MCNKLHVSTHTHTLMHTHSCTLLPILRSDSSGELLHNELSKTILQISRVGEVRVRIRVWIRGVWGAKGNAWAKACCLQVSSPSTHHDSMNGPMFSLSLGWGSLLGLQIRVRNIRREELWFNHRFYCPCWSLSVLIPTLTLTLVLILSTISNPSPRSSPNPNPKASVNP